MARSKTPLHLFELYENSVQDAKAGIELYGKIYQEISGKPALRLREDFCGTFLYATTWVKTRPDRKALAIDLDRTPLEYGIKHHWAKLSASEKKRLQVKKHDVRLKTAPCDLIIAGNFSFNIFHDSDVLVDYMRSARQSLAPGGVHLLEVAGGPGMIEPMKERKVVRRKGKRWFTYVWDQQSFDPITHVANYAIHFYMADGRKIKNAFTYHWRLWSIPELRRAFLEAGYRDVAVYFEVCDEQDNNTGIYARTESAPNHYAWVSYVAGIR